MLAAQQLREILRYDAETGVFTWRARRGGTAIAGSAAGTVNAKGYVHIHIDAKKYLAHRLAWLYVYGTYPQGPLDHKDRCRSNNRLDNLRQATDSENAQNTGHRKNNSTGFKGVSLSKRDGRWVANIKLLGKQQYLGAFDTAEEASIAYRRAAAKLHTHNPEAS